MRRDVPSFLPLAAFYPWMCCILWWPFILSSLTNYIFRRIERKQKCFGQQLRNTTLAIGLVLRSFNNPYKISQWQQICQLHWTSTDSGQHTSTGSFTCCRRRNLCITGSSVPLKVTNFTFKHERNQFQNQIQIHKRSWLPLAKEHLQLQEHFGELKVVAYASISRQTL